MEEMPITLDDGDFWLPSDIFPPDELHSCSSRVASVDDLSCQLGGLGVFDRSSYVIPRPELFGRVGVGLGLGTKGVTATSPYGSYALTVSPTVDQAFPNFARPGPGFIVPNNPSLRRYDVVQPVQPQVVGQLMESEIATRTSNRQEHRPQTRSMCSPFAFQENGFRFNSDSRGLTFGTGVFIPRATPSSSIHRKKPSGMTSHGMRHKTVGLGRGKEYYQHGHQITSSEMRLPKDWTY